MKPSPQWRLAAAGVAACSLAMALVGCSGRAGGSSVASSEPPSSPTTSERGASSPAAVVATETPANAAPHTAAPPSVVATPAAMQLPVTIVQIGDSLGEDLGYGLRDVLAGVDGVTLVRASKGSSGLVQPQYYDWPHHLQELLAQYHPQLVVVFIGANDVQNFYSGGVLQHFGTPGWRAAYSARVATLMQEAVDAGAQVLWVGMPIMRSAVFANSMRQLNEIYQAQAQAHPGVTYYSSWELFSTPDGAYTNTKSDDAGRPIVLRAPDGIHVAFGSGGGGADYLAQAVVTELHDRYGLAVSRASAS